MSTTSAAPSLYDLLDVAPDASAEEIRAAWRSAIDGLEPGDRRFRAYNAAAEALLDRDRRAAYDAELADGADARLDPRRPSRWSSAVSTRLDAPVVEQRAAASRRSRRAPSPGGCWSGWRC